MRTLPFVIIHSFSTIEQLPMMSVSSEERPIKKPSSRQELPHATEIQFGSTVESSVVISGASARVRRAVLIALSCCRAFEKIRVNVEH
jgi:hypothetical protein